MFAGLTVIHGFLSRRPKNLLRPLPIDRIRIQGVYEVLFVPTAAVLGLTTQLPRRINVCLLLVGTN